MPMAVTVCTHGGGGNETGKEMLSASLRPFDDIGVSAFAPCRVYGKILFDCAVPEKFGKNFSAHRPLILKKMIFGNSSNFIIA
jgi:hypothetical protein